MKYLVLLSVLGFSQISFGEIAWKNYSASALTQAKKARKKVVLGFHKKGCGTCQVQDEILEKTGITNNENVTFLKVERKDSSHKKIYEKYGFSSRQWAALVMLNNDGGEIARIKPGSLNIKLTQAFANKAK